MLNRVRIGLLWILPLGVALVSWRFLVLGVEASMPFVSHFLNTHRVALFAHIGLAPIVLALVPVQFWAGLRKRRPALHRWAGRLYAGLIVISGVAALSLAVGSSAGPIASWGFGILAVLWIAVTAQAVRLAMLRRIAEHRRWMIRSAALTLAAVTLRIYLPLLAMGLGFDTAYLIIAWLCWVPNALIAEWIIRRESAPSERAFG